MAEKVNITGVVTAISSKNGRGAVQVEGTWYSIHQNADQDVTLPERGDTVSFGAYGKSFYRFTKSNKPASAPVGAPTPAGRPASAQRQYGDLSEHEERRRNRAIALSQSSTLLAGTDGTVAHLAEMALELARLFEPYLNDEETP